MKFKLLYFQIFFQVFWIWNDSIYSPLIQNLLKISISIRVILLRIHLLEVNMFLLTISVLIIHPLSQHEWYILEVKLWRCPKTLKTSLWVLKFTCTKKSDGYDVINILIGEWNKFIFTIWNDHYFVFVVSEVTYDEIVKIQIM